jgi:hypothetical protein
MPEEHYQANGKNLLKRIQTYLTEMRKENLVTKLCIILFLNTLNFLMMVLSDRRQWRG